MLDDIKKIIPKLDEKDSEAIYEKLSKKKMEKKSIIFNSKIIMAFVTVALLILVIIPVGIIINNFNSSPIQTPNLNDSSGNNELQYNNNYAMLNEKSVIGIAAFNEFDNKGVRKLSNVTSEFNNKDSVLSDSNEEENLNEEYLKISYPYDYVKINSAYKFSINVLNIEDKIAKEIIESNCGLGELEIVVAKFETYVEEKGYNYLSVKDTLICLRGYNGYYTILVNSGEFRKDSSLQVFSSHKKLTEDEVSKDFTPPILSIFLKEETNSRYVYFETSDNLLSFGNYNQDLAFKNTTEIEAVSRNTLYSVLELTKLPVKEVEATVLEIDSEYKMIKVQTENNLEYVHINEHTEGVKIENINVGDIVIIEYDFLFEKYNPIKVIANSITIKTSFGGE